MYTFLETTFSGIVLLPPFINFFLQDLENADPSESVAIFFSFGTRTPFFFSFPVISFNRVLFIFSFKYGIFPKFVGISNNAFPICTKKYYNNRGTFPLYLP